MTSARGGRGGRWLAAGVAAGLTALLACGCGLGDPDDRDVRTSEGPPEPQPRPSRLSPRDPEDANAALRARRRREARLVPALQHLPFHQGGVSIDIGEANRDGRLQLTVTYAGTATAARAAYQRFLRRWGDSGHAYAVRYQQAPGGRAFEAPLAALRESPQEVLEAVATTAGNWSADRVDAAFGRAIALSVGAARDRLAQAATQARAGIARVGSSLHSQAVVTAIDVRGVGPSRRAVVVTREALSGSGGPARGYEYRVILASVELGPDGWAVSSWEPQP